MEVCNAEDEEGVFSRVQARDGGATGEQRATADAGGDRGGYFAIYAAELASGGSRWERAITGSGVTGIALAAVAGPGQDPGRLVGGVYAANTVGAIVGSVISGLVLVVWLGTHTSMQVLIVISALSALMLGADAMITSTHKIVGWLTQSGMLHVGATGRIDPDAVARTGRLMRSTSPSALLMASLDGARR